MKSVALLFGIIGLITGIVISLSIISLGNGQSDGAIKELGNTLVAFGVVAFLLFFFILLISALSNRPQRTSREPYIFVTIFALIIIALTVVGYQESLAMDKENKDTGEYVYKTPEDAIKDAGSRALIDEIENKGYIVYRDSNHVLEDIDEEDLADELRFKKRSHFYGTDTDQ